jgi:hypothetical protein
MGCIQETAAAVCQAQRLSSARADDAWLPNAVRIDALFTRARSALCFPRIPTRRARASATPNLTRCSPPRPSAPSTPASSSTAAAARAPRRSRPRAASPPQARCPPSPPAAPHAAYSRRPRPQRSTSGWRYRCDGPSRSVRARAADRKPAQLAPLASQHHLSAYSRAKFGPGGAHARAPCSQSRTPCSCRTRRRASPLRTALGALARRRARAPRPPGAAVVRHALLPRTGARDRAARSCVAGG